MTISRNLIAGALALVLTGCGAAAGAPASGPLPENAATVEVRNNNWSDMKVYAVHGGTRYRLGTVTSMTTERFDLPRAVALPGADLQLLVDPIGGTRTFNTGPIDVGPGQEVDFTIQNHLAISHYSVWDR